MTNGLHFRMLGPLSTLRIDGRAGRYILDHLSAEERRGLADFLSDLRDRPILAGMTVGHNFWLFNMCHHILEIRVVAPGYGILTRIYPDTFRRHLALRKHLSSMGGSSPSRTDSSQTSAPPLDIHAETRTSESAIIQSAGVVAGAAVAAGAVNVIRNIVGVVKDSFDIKKHMRDNAQRNKGKSEKSEE